MSYLHDLEKLVLINSYTKNKKGVDKVSFLMKQWLEEIGFKTHIFKRDLIGNHFLFKSKKKHGKKILFLGHNDTVFPKNTFEIYKEDKNWVYGPGVCDMKGGNIVALQSLRDLFNKNNKIFNIDFLLVSDEESGSDDSKNVTLDIAKDYDYCFVFEAAGKKLEFVSARKGVGTFKITINGKSAHSGTNYKDGINANLEASYKLQNLQNLTNLKLGTTVNVGKINGGIGANIISNICELEFEIRYTNNIQRDKLLNKINKITNKSYIKNTFSILSGSIQREVMIENDLQKKLIKNLQNITNEKIYLEHRGGVSDANHVSSKGVITIDGFGPFGDGDHTINERASKKSFIKRINFLDKILEYHQKYGHF